MKVFILEDDDMYKMLGERHDPPNIENQKEENAFQAEIRTAYVNLLEVLCPFGQEGDLYGISDFAVRPDMRDRPTVRAPPAPHVRQFCITCLTEAFYRSAFWNSVHKFISGHGRRYQVLLDQDFDQQWSLKILFTYDIARVNCTEAQERSRLVDVLTNL